MQAYKLKGAIDEAGNLIVNEPIKMAPGEVEIIVLQTVEKANNDTGVTIEPQTVKPKRQVECSIPILKEWLENTNPVPPDFDPDQAKWEYLKEKHNL